ncbi:MAG: inner-rane translocator [Pseudonocardiales bacterium]|nr:inner-rane translocator [Jatrophihabitantaceae bacterium]MCW2603637.1 inner-rane translocator [Pseudonocardiales bacterium]
MSSPDLGQPTPGAPAAQVAPAASPGVALAASDFANDVGARNAREAFGNYIQRLRGGDMGALPAVGGLIVLVIVFASISGGFLSKGNFANLLTQAAPIMLLGMGLVFILLLGEIDLSAGTASGVSAAIMGLALTQGGDLNQALGTPVYVIVLLGMLAAALVAGFYRIWIAVGVIVLGALVMLTSWDQYAIPGIFVAISVGVAIGTLVGTMVAKIGIPSFVVTLALFLGWQGVLLQFLGNGSAIDVRRNDFIFNLENSNFSPAVGWAIWAVSIAAYLGLTFGRSFRRRRAGLTAEPLLVVALRGFTLAAITGVAVYVLNENRGRTVFTKIEGIPKIIPVVLVLLVFFTFILTRTAFGRHLYAVGGNAEAARRAGIDVVRIRVAAFIISGAMTAIAGIALASRLGSIPSDFGGRNTLLFAVAAAVIGGTSLFGGKGKMRDAVIGGLVIAIIPNGLGLIKDIPSSYELMITAGVLLLAASVDALSRKRTSAR